MVRFRRNSVARLKIVFFISLAASAIFTIQVLFNKSILTQNLGSTRIAENYSRAIEDSSIATTRTSEQRASPARFLKTPLTLNSSCWERPCSKERETNGKMVFLIKSTAGHASFRELHRRTWASLSYVEGLQFSSVFIIGKVDAKRQAIVDEEYERYGDILQVNISDGYSFVAQKTLAGMQWASENLNDDVYYTSCDDDIMIDISGLVKEMNWRREKVKDEKWGDFPIICIYKAKVADGPNRNKKSKYYISYKEYKWRYYPDYCLGGAYTTSVGVVRQLWDVSRTTKQLRMDDVWITGILRERIGMPRQYVRHLDNALATHYNGFSGKITNYRRDFMKEDWEKLQEKFENLTICTC